MGNEGGKSTGNLGTSAVATVCTIQEVHLMQLFKTFRKAAAEVVTRDDVNGVTEGFTDVEPIDLELMDKLFTMFDVVGDGSVNYKDYLAGLVPLTTMSAKDKLHLALKLFDSKRTGQISRAELRRLLLSINNVASYFGDPVVKDIEISSMVSDIFRMQASTSSTLKYEDYFDAIYDHVTAHIFLIGKGTQLFGGKQ
jgi:Ca2+-binding EF-hand superfamily protein